MSVIDRERLPQHVGIIMDGNGRWAKQRGLKRTQGHREGARVFRRICEYANDIGIRYITFLRFFHGKLGAPAGRGLRYYGALT